MSTITTTAPTVAVAPAHPAGIGHATKGGHVVHWRAQTAFDLNATLQLTSAHNPWRPTAPGFAFYNAVLAPLGLSETTVGAVIESAGKAGYKAGVAQGHLRWLYTWGNYMLIGGALHPAFGGTASQPNVEGTIAPEFLKVEPEAAPARKSKGKK
jgi:hypothetical protein